MRIAALDIGTNTVLLLIVQQTGVSQFKVLLDRHAIARLGEGVDETGMISETAYERFRAVLGEHMSEIQRLRVDRILAIATSAMRDATNREEITDRVQKEIGIAIEVISGAAESELTFRGALVGLQLPSGCSQIAVVDIGGGSTEVSFGSPTHFQSGKSFDIGAVRMTERYLSKRPISGESLDRAVSSMSTTFQSLQPHSSKIQELVAVAGSPTTLASMDLQLEQFDRARVQGYRLYVKSIDRLIGEIELLSFDALIEKYPVINKGRADIILAGSLILREAMHHLSVDSVLVSTRGLRYGIAMQALEHTLNVPGTAWQITEA